MAKKIRIFFVGDVTDSFIKRDYEILKNYFDVNVIQLPKKRIGWLKYIFILARNVKQCDLTFSWFADIYAMVAVFFSKLFGIKSIVVVGGSDAAYVPELKYGAFTKIKTKIPAIYVYKSVDKVLVVDLALKEDIIKNAKVSGSNIEYLPTGYDSDYWKPKIKKENIVLTVAPIDDIKRIKLKGLDTFVKAARQIQEAKLIVVGIKAEAKSNLEKISSKNVELVEYLPETELIKYYQMAKVYCQLSYREGLPNSLCEAMLCECIPVGTDVQGVRTAIGDAGFYVNYGNLKATVDMIKKALALKDNLGKKARDRIIKFFPVERRKNGLVKTINDLLVEK